MRLKTRSTFAALTLAAVATFGLSACTMAAPSAETDTPAPAASEPSMENDFTADLVGSGCAAYADANPSGGGSIVGMAQDPVAVAASNNPLLTTLVAAVSGKLNPDVNLVDTLNGDEFTVIAPVNEAFDKIPKKDLEAVAGNADELTKVLTYHVIPGQLSPDEIVGEQETVEGSEVKIAGSGDDLTFDDAKLVCGGVKTANATVYMVDSVLMPPK